MKLGVGVLNNNDRRSTLRLLCQLDGVLSFVDEIYVLDNMCSPDQQVKGDLRRFGVPMHYDLTWEWESPASGNNALIGKMLVGKCTRIWLLDQKRKIELKQVKQMLDWLNGEYDLIGTPAGIEKRDEVGRLINREWENSWIGMENMMMKAEVARNLKGFWAGYYRYFEDVDFCLRAKQAGYLIKVLDGERGNEANIKSNMMMDGYFLGRNSVIVVARLTHGWRKWKLLAETVFRNFKAVVLDWVMRGKTRESGKKRLRGVYDGLKLVNKF